MNQEALRREAIEEYTREAEQKYKACVRQRLSAIAETQSQIAALALKLADQRQALKALAYEAPDLSGLE